jgi:predicted DsbA family dithiol-disulfide isomerase
MVVEVWSDVVCPWCWIGKRRLERAIELVARDDIEVRFRSFELDPRAVSSSSESLTAMLAKKYGMPLAKAEEMQRHVARTGAADGLDFHFEQAKPSNTFDAHRLIHHAASQGLGLEMKERLMQAYFSQGRAVGDHETLLGLAVEVGLDREGAAAVLAGDAYADAVRADEDEAHAIGARGVPFFVFDRRLAVSGAQPAEVLAAALRQALADVPAGEVCDDDGCAVP